MKRIASILTACALTFVMCGTALAEGPAPVETSKLPTDGNYLYVLGNAPGENARHWYDEDAPKLPLKFEITYDKKGEISTQTIETFSNNIDETDFRLNVSPAWITSIKLTTETEIAFDDLWIEAITWNAFPHRIYNYANQDYIDSDYGDYMPVTIPAGTTELLGLNDGEYNWVGETFEPAVINYLNISYDVTSPLKDTGKPVEMSTTLGSVNGGTFLGYTDPDTKQSIADKFVKQGPESFGLRFGISKQVSINDFKKTVFMVDPANAGLQVKNLKIEVVTELITLDTVKYDLTTYILGKLTLDKAEYTFDSEYTTFKKSDFNETTPLNEYFERYVKTGEEYIGSVFGETTLWILTGIAGLAIGFVVGYLLKKKKKDAPAA